jgi:hypothetical protein
MRALPDGNRILALLYSQRLGYALNVHKTANSNQYRVGDIVPWLRLHGADRVGPLYGQPAGILCMIHQESRDLYDKMVKLIVERPSASPSRR